MALPLNGSDALAAIEPARTKFPRKPHINCLLSAEGVIGRELEGQTHRVTDQIQWASQARALCWAGQESDALNGIGGQRQHPSIASESSTNLEYPPQGQVRTKLESRPSRDSHLQFEWIAPGFTETCFWAAPRLLIAGAGKPGVVDETAPGPTEPE